MSDEETRDEPETAEIAPQGAPQDTEIGELDRVEIAVEADLKGAERHLLALIGAIRSHGLAGLQELEALAVKAHKALTGK